MTATAAAVTAPDATVVATQVTRTFVRGGVAVPALRGVDLTVAPGTMVALHGRSGSGKTTLLNVVGGLDEPTSGSVRVCGVELTGVSEAERVALRRDRIAFVFQAFGLLPVLSAAENVEVPLRLHRTPGPERRERVAQLLDLVGLGHRATHRPSELSGGEQQRVAIARALANTPELLIADEPTGQLDSGTGRRIMDLLRALVDEQGLAMLVATHDPTLLADADLVLELRDGRLGTGAVAPRFDGDVDRSRLLSASTTLPAPVSDPEAAFRPDADPPTVVPPAAGDVRLVGEDATPPRDQRGQLRWGPDGEPVEE